MTHTTAPPFAHSVGPKSGVKLAFVGEAWGEKEELLRCPFVGAAGREFAKLLYEAELADPLPKTFMGELDMRSWWQHQCHRHGWFLTNTFAFRPPDNSIPALCCKKADLPPDYALPAIDTGKYIRPEYLPELARLYDELSQVRPNLVIPLGATASWALLRTRAIGSIRGAITSTHQPPGLKCLPVNHPAAVLYNWAMRPVLLADLMKARRECEFPDIRRPKRYITVEPTLADIANWELLPAERYAVDIETFKGQISMIGFARSPTDALVIPFVDPSKSDFSYWPSHADELCAWQAVNRLLLRPEPKVFQNGLYDLQYILRMGLRPRNCADDTMILHHARYPEMQKGLGFLGSIYSNEASWKLARHNDSNKREE